MWGRFFEPLYGSLCANKRSLHLRTSVEISGIWNDLILCLYPACGMPSWNPTFCSAIIVDHDVKMTLEWRVGDDPDLRLSNRFDPQLRDQILTRLISTDGCAGGLRHLGSRVWAWFCPGNGSFMVTWLNFFLKSCVISYYLAWKNAALHVCFADKLLRLLCGGGHPIWLIEGRVKQLSHVYEVFSSLRFTHANSSRLYFCILTLQIHRHILQHLCRHRRTTAWPWFSHCLRIIIWFFLAPLIYLVAQQSLMLDGSLFVRQRPFMCLE